MILCMKCGTQNDPKENYCQSCGATLPKLAYTMEMPQKLEKVFDLYHKFADVAEKVKTGLIPMEKFDEFMADMQEKLGRKEQEIREVEIPEDIMSEFVEELELGFTGMEKVSHGMERMHEYVDGRDMKCLDEGLELIHEGLEYVHKAKIYNRTRDRGLAAEADIQREEKAIEI